MSAFQASTGGRGIRPAGGHRRNGHAASEPATPIPDLPVRIAPRKDDSGVRARILLTLPTGAEIEITRTIVSAIAHSLWQLRGQDHLTNWLDAESVLNQMLEAGQPPPAPAMRRGNSVAPVRSSAATPPRRVVRNDDDDDMAPGPLQTRSARLRRR